MLRMKGARRSPDLGAVDEDARHLALELAGLMPPREVDVMRTGLVLEAGERPWRQVAGELRHLAAGSWEGATSCAGLVTNRRLLLRALSGPCLSLWWGSLVVFEPHLSGGHVVFDYGDGLPRLWSGRQTQVVAVAGVVALYGVAGLMAHPALEPLRETS